MIIIDRIEEGIAVCEIGGGQMLLELRQISEAKEGDVIFYSFGEGCWRTDTETIAARREKILSRVHSRRRRREQSKESV